MTNDVWLTPTDVAEAFHCSVADVLVAIENGQLPARRSRGLRIAHSDLEIFAATLLRSGIALGEASQFEPNFVFSRPFNGDANKAIE
jgi:hypothetical protein